MLGLELVVVLGAALVACRVGAQRTGIAAPMLLLAAGVLLGFIPAFSGPGTPVRSGTAALPRRNITVLRAESLINDDTVLRRMQASLDLEEFRLLDEPDDDE
jgi:hypothetical protein